MRFDRVENRKFKAKFINSLLRVNRLIRNYSLQKFLSESLNHLEKMYPGNGSGVTSSQQSGLDTNKSKDGTLMNDMKKWRPDDPPTSNVVTSIRHSWPYNWAFASFSFFSILKSRTASDGPLRRHVYVRVRTSHPRAPL